MHIVYVLCAVTAVLIIAVCCHPRMVSVPVGGFEYSVVGSYANHDAAAAMIDDCNQNLLRFMRYLRAKYLIDAAGQTAQPSADAYADPTIKSIAHAADVRAIVHSIIYNYNPEVIEENDPRTSTDTSYTVDKGRRIMLCVRDKEDPNRLVDPNTLMFVVLHEVGGHIGNYNGWQHTTRFWTIFKFVLNEASEFGIYKPIDYAKHPARYCGITIDYQPLYDRGLENLWE